MKELDITDNLDEVLRSVSALEKDEVLVGVPSDHAQRDDDAPINNAVLAYINEFGSPANNLPARPSLIPGVQKALPKVGAIFEKAAGAALDGKPANVREALEAAGMLAASSVRATLQAGEGFAPLTDAALRSRLYRARKGFAPGKTFGGKKSVRMELAIRAGRMERPEGFVSPKPLIDTGELLRSFTYVVHEDE